MSDLSKRVRAVRRTISVRERTKLVGAIVYACECGMNMQVSLARGVEAPDEWSDGDPGIPAPREIPCNFCGERAVYEAGSHEHRMTGFDRSKPYVRVPSKHKLAEIVEGGRFEAQLVIPPGWDE